MANSNSTDDTPEDFQGLAEIKRRLSKYVDEGVVDMKVLTLLFGPSGFAPIESALIDYKFAFQANQTGFANLIKQVLSLHNTFGGYLIFGVEESERDSVFSARGIEKNILKQQQIRSLIREYTGRSIDVSVKDLTFPIGHEEGNICLIHVPKRLVNDVPVKIGKSGPIINGRPVFENGDVFFRVQDTNAKAKAAEDWWFLSGDRISPYSNPKALPEFVGNNIRLIVDENLPDRNFICPRFVGRGEEIIGLWQWLSDDFQFAKVLAGDGGKGKTSIAYQFAEEICRSKPYDFEKVVWLTAKTQQFRGFQDDFDPVEAHYSSYEELLRVLCEAFPLLAEEIDGASPQLLKRFLKQALESTRALIIVDDVDSLTFDDQRMVLEAAMQIGNGRSRFLLTTRMNVTYSDDLVIAVKGMESEDFAEYVQDLLARFAVPTGLSRAKIEMLRKATDGSPLYTESLLRLIRNNMKFDDAISKWKGTLGLKVRRAALEREIHHLPVESRVVLLTAAYLFECSYTELMEVSGYEDDQLNNCIDNLRALFLIGAPSIIKKEARFTVQSNTRSLVLRYEKSLSEDFEKIRTRCEEVRAGTSGMARSTQRRQIASAITQATAFMRISNWNGAFETLTEALKSKPGDPDLLFSMGKYYLMQSKPDYGKAKKSFTSAYEMGLRKYQLYAAWYECEVKSNHAKGAIQVANLALTDGVTERVVWLVNRAAAYQLSASAGRKSNSVDQEIADLKRCNTDLITALPLAKGNQADEIKNILESVGGLLTGLAFKHAVGVPGWVRAFDTLQEIWIPDGHSDRVADRLATCVEKLGDVLLTDGEVSSKQFNLFEIIFHKAMSFIAANNTESNKEEYGAAADRAQVTYQKVRLLEENGRKPNGHSLPEKYDVFLAHNSRDKVAVRFIDEALRSKGISTWLDEAEVPPGQLFQDYIQRALPQSKSIAIFVGPNGLGKWQAFELRAAISRAVERGIPVLPVFLPGAKDISEELPFLKEFHHVDFFEIGDERALEKLVWGVKFRSKPEQ